MLYLSIIFLYFQVPYAIWSAISVMEGFGRSMDILIRKLGKVLDFSFSTMEERPRDLSTLPSLPSWLILPILPNYHYTEPVNHGTTIGVSLPPTEAYQIPFLLDRVLSSSWKWRKKLLLVSSNSRIASAFVCTPLPSKLNFQPPRVGLVVNK